MRKYIILTIILITVTSFSAPVLFQKGEKARKSGDISKARQFYFKFFTRNPESSYAPVAMYRYALSNLPYEKAVAYLNRILKKYPNYKYKYKIIDKIAMLHYLKDNYKECIRTLNDTVVSNSAPKSYRLRAYYYVGKSYFLMGKPAKARKFFTLIIKDNRNPYTALAELELAEIYFRYKKYNKAKNAYENVVRKYPESEAELKAVYRLGIIYSRLDDLEKAKAAYNYIIQSYPMSLEASFAKDKLKNLSNSKGKKPLKEKIANSYAPPADNEDSKKSPAKKHNEPKQSTLTQTNNKVKLTLHIGNYRAKYRGYVRLLLKRLKRNGFKAYIKKRKINGRWYYTLRVGSFENKNKAMKRAYVIKKKLRLRVRIVGKT